MLENLENKCTRGDGEELKIDKKGQVTFKSWLMRCPQHTHIHTETPPQTHQSVHILTGPPTPLAPMTKHYLKLESWICLDIPAQYPTQKAKAFQKPAQWQ